MSVETSRGTKIGLLMVAVLWACGGLGTLWILAEIRDSRASNMKRIDALEDGAPALIHASWPHETVDFKMDLAFDAMPALEATLARFPPEKCR